MGKRVIERSNSKKKRAPTSALLREPVPMRKSTDIEKPKGSGLVEVLQSLYEREINVRIESFWDAGWEVGVGGDPIKGHETRTSFENSELDDIIGWLLDHAGMYPERSTAELLRRIEMLGFDCEAGPLENFVDWQVLKRRLLREGATFQSVTRRG
jgi:hypothetical protein